MCGARVMPYCEYETGRMVRKPYSPVEPVSTRPYPWKFGSRSATRPFECRYDPFASHCQISTTALRTGAPVRLRTRPEK